MTGATAVPVVVLVLFPATPPADVAALRELLATAGPEYVNIPGLRRKYFLSGEGVAGGIYEWVDGARAAAFHDEAWHADMTRRYGTRPEVRFFDSPAIADGQAGRLDIFLPGA